MPLDLRGIPARLPLLSPLSPILVEPKTGGIATFRPNTPQSHWYRRVYPKIDATYL